MSYEITSDPTIQVYPRQKLHRKLTNLSNSFDMQAQKKERKRKQLTAKT